MAIHERACLPGKVSAHLVHHTPYRLFKIVTSSALSKRQQAENIVDNRRAHSSQELQRASSRFAMALFCGIWPLRLLPGCLFRRRRNRGSTSARLCARRWPRTNPLTAAATATSTAARRGGGFVPLLQDLAAFIVASGRAIRHFEVPM